MGISSDWSVDYVNKIISHIDGTMNWDGSSGTPPSVGNYIRGSTSEAVGKVLSVVDNGTSGSVTITNVVGRFQNNESLVVLDELPFDGVVLNSTFKTGTTVYQDASTGTFLIYAIDYNDNVQSNPGEGKLYGALTNSFSDNNPIKITSNAGTTVALTRGSSSSKSSLWASAAVDGSLTASTTSIIINFNSLGLNSIPRFSKIWNDATGTKKALVQDIWGSGTTGSIRLLDITGVWAEADNIFQGDILNVTSGIGFKVGDLITGATSGNTGKILAINTNALTLQNKTGGAWSNGENIKVSGSTITTVANLTHGVDTSANVVTTTPGTGGVLRNQLISQGGIYSEGSLNPVRDCNSLYTFLQDTFDELGAMDDEIPLTAQVKLQQYTLINGWEIPDFSYRFLESGSIQDQNLDNVWTNFQTLGSIGGITSTVFLPSTTQQPQIYIEQNQLVIDPWWIQGNIDVLVKVKTNSDVRYATGDTGSLINNGTVTVFCRKYGDTYDNFTTTTIAGVAPVPLATAADLDNTTGTHTLDYDTELSGPFLEGEEIYKITDETKRGVITSLTDNGTTGTIEFIKTGSTLFSTDDGFKGVTSGATAEEDGVGVATLVAGYGTNISVATIEQYWTFDTGSGTPYNGEYFRNAGDTVRATMMKKTGTTTGTIYFGNSNGTIATGTWTGVNSGATVVLTGTTSTENVITKDIGDGNGEENYEAVIYCSKNNTKQNLSKAYEWIKYITRSQETGGDSPSNNIGGPGSEEGYQGRIYKSLDTTYPLVKVSPLGSFAGGTFFGARGVFIQDMHNNDIRSYQLINTSGVVRTPPNLQSISFGGLVVGDTVGIYKSDGLEPPQIDLTQYSLVATDSDYNDQGDTIVKISTSIETETVTTNGVIRLYNETTELYDRYTYTSIDTTVNEFIGISPALTKNYGDQTLKYAFVPYIEKAAESTSESVTVEYVSGSIPLIGRVRKKGILPFEVSSSFGSTGASLTAIRTADTIVD